MQSRTATGVRVQRLDEGNAVQAVVVVPEATDDEEDSAPRTAEVVAEEEEGDVEAPQWVVMDAGKETPYIEEAA